MGSRKMCSNSGSDNDKEASLICNDLEQGQEMTFLFIYSSLVNRLISTIHDGDKKTLNNAHSFPHFLSTYLVKHSPVIQKTGNGKEVTSMDSEAYKCGKMASLASSPYLLTVLFVHTIFSLVSLPLLLLSIRYIHRMNLIHHSTRHIVILNLLALMVHSVTRIAMHGTDLVNYLTPHISACEILPSYTRCHIMRVPFNISMYLACLSTITIALERLVSTFTSKDYENNRSVGYMLLAFQKQSMKQKMNPELRQRYNVNENLRTITIVMPFCCTSCVFTSIFLAIVIILLFFSRLIPMDIYYALTDGSLLLPPYAVLLPFILRRMSRYVTQEVWGVSFINLVFGPSSLGCPQGLKWAERASLERPLAPPDDEIV
ncbi:hypothetical protein ANCCEY_09450 [Ancylostoma ceylanicum]|uniref:G-protein coupled receptors family 1 profile domain-containing protein n=1 Tax=Ancylostoma ceylanicum TaxID=53326 RepID=A0A0D6LV03_9BILA|nr:hypothetical protein ANCCEY_09450 [Ancylostoma ceylanicum]